MKKKVLTEHSPADGSLIRIIPVKAQPYHIAIDCTDRVVISDKEREVDVTDGNGATLFTMITPTIEGKQVEYSYGVACGSSGIYIAMYAGDDGTGHVHRYGDGGQFLGCVAKGLYRPQGMAFTADGRQLAVADYHSVKMYHVVG